MKNITILQRSMAVILIALVSYVYFTKNFSVAMTGGLGLMIIFASSIIYIETAVIATILKRTGIIVGAILAGYTLCEYSAMSNIEIFSVSVIILSVVVDGITFNSEAQK